MLHHTHTHRVFDVRPGTESLAPAAVVLTSAMAGGDAATRQASRRFGGKKGNESKSRAKKEAGRGDGRVGHPAGFGCFFHP